MGCCHFYINNVDFYGHFLFQFFLSNRAVYLLLWNVRLGHEHAGLDFWLSSISVQCPKVPIFVVGSHIDQVNLTLEEPRLKVVELANKVQSSS